MRRIFFVLLFGVLSLGMGATAFAQMADDQSDLLDDDVVVAAAMMQPGTGMGMPGMGQQGMMNGTWMGPGMGWGMMPGMGYGMGYGMMSGLCPMVGSGMAGGMMGPRFAGSSIFSDYFLMWTHLPTLGLSSQQWQTIRNIKSRTTRDVIRKRADMQVAMIDLRDLLVKEPVDLKAVESRIRQIATMRADTSLQMIKAAEEVKATLTPDQRKKLRDILDTTPAMGGTWMGPGMGRGMMGPGMMRGPGMMGPGMMSPSTTPQTPSPSGPGTTQ